MSNSETTDSSTFWLNGREVKHLRNMTITDLLSANDAAGPGVAVERNQKVVCRTDHSKTVIKAGDKIEIVRLVGGG